MSFYSFIEILHIIVICKTKDEIIKMNDIVFVYKKSFSLNDLQKLKILIKSQYDYLKLLKK